MSQEEVRHLWAGQGKRWGRSMRWGREGGGVKMILVIAYYSIAVLSLRVALGNTIDTLDSIDPLWASIYRGAMYGTQ